jgi:hypothetical protein
MPYASSGSNRNKPTNQPMEEENTLIQKIKQTNRDEER